MDLSSDGSLLACSNRDSGTVTIVGLEKQAKLFEVSVGTHPEGVSFVGDTHNLAVAVYGEDKVVLIDGSTGNHLAEIPVFDEPYGIVSSTSGEHLYVTLDYPGKVVQIDVAQRQVVRQLDVGRFVRGIARLDSASLLVVEFYTAVVKRINLTDWSVVDEWEGPRSDNLARQIVVHPRRPKAYLPHARSRVTATHGAGSIFPYVAIVDTQRGEGRRRKRVPMDAFRGNLVTANPWEVSVSRDGRSLFVVFSGTDDLFACEIIDDDYREIAYRGYRRIGANPRAVRASIDGQSVYIYNALDFNVVELDAESLEENWRIQVTENPLGEQELLGKKLFYSALQPVVGRRWISCSSCHPDGQPDGRTWHNPEGLRNTQSLAGLKWTHPIHWSADRDEVQDFEHTIRGPLMQGRGLIDGQVNAQLGPINRGLSKQLDALAAYTNSHRFELSPHARNGLDAAAKRGKQIFFSEKTACATCHSGPLYTDSRSTHAPEKPLPIRRHDVGTGTADPTEKMGPKYDTPTLLGLYRTAPYLHHGKAETLQELLVQYNSADRHGVTSHLTPDQIDDLARFLKSLPYTDPSVELDGAESQ